MSGFVIGVLSEAALCRDIFGRSDEMPARHSEQGSCRYRQPGCQRDTPSRDHAGTVNLEADQLAEGGEAG